MPTKKREKTVEPPRSNQCPNSERCGAPICPMEPQDHPHMVWYPDEEICRLQKFGRLTYVRNMRLIKKKAKNIDLYFSFKMLNYRYRIRQGIEGVDPDHPIEEAERREVEWIKKHPETTDEAIQKMRERATFGKKEEEEFGEEPL